MFFDSTKLTVGILGVTCVLILSSSIHAQNIVTTSQPTAVTILDSTKAQDGLTGSVRRVRTESAKLEVHGETLVEGSRQLLEITTYNPRGDRVDNVSYPLKNALVGKEEYKYDDKGNMVEMTLKDEDGTILSKEAYDYEFDNFGNWTKMVTNLLVFEGGKLKREPIEVTYRTLTYYFDENIAKIVDPVPTKKLPETRVLSELKESNAPLELTKPVEVEKKFDSARNVSERRSDSNLNPHSGLEPTKPIATEKSSPSASDNNQTPVSSILSANPAPESTNPEKPGETPAPMVSDSDSPNRSTVQRLLTSPSARATGASSEGPKGEDVASSSGPARENAASTKGLDYFKEGRSRFEEGDLKGALTAYLKSIELQPDSAEVHLSLGLVYLKLDKNKDAAKAFKNSVRLEPTSAEAQYGLGLANFRLSRHKDAADAFKQATVLRPDMAKAHYGLALSYQELGKTDAVIAQFRILQTLDANLAKQLAQAFPEFNFPCGPSSRCR
ncbi:MAG TPA: tetratricopeptide repeat protein [Pyrinomonadaceae bacterium]|nr:tetratricopeptide repeat protein [Pyrinomonadaceae bacterium]